MKGRRPNEGVFGPVYVWCENTMYCLDMISETLFSSPSINQQDKLSELDGFRDFVFVISSILRIMVIGNYLPSLFGSTLNTQNMVTKWHILLKCLINTPWQHALPCLDCKKSHFPHSHRKPRDFCQKWRLIAEAVHQLFSCCFQFSKVIF